MAEYMYDNKTKNFKLIEINPRIWGSILGSEICNSKLIKNYIKLSLNEKPIQSKKIKKIYIRWLIPYDIINWIKSGFRPLNFLINNKNTVLINITLSRFRYFFFYILIEYLIEFFRKK